MLELKKVRGLATARETGNSMQRTNWKGSFRWGSKTPYLIFSVPPELYTRKEDEAQAN